MVRPSQSRPRQRVIVAGHLCLDIIPTFTAPVKIEPGRLVEASGTTFSGGGAVANVGVALLRLGVDVGLVASLGDDAFGRELQALLARHGRRAVETLRLRPEQQTSYTVVIDPPGSDRSFVHDPGSNATFDPAEIDPAVADGAAIFYYGYPPLLARSYADGGRALAELFAELQARGVATALDMTLPDPNVPSGQVDWAAYLARVLPHVDIFVPSLDELLFMLERPAFDRGEAAGDDAVPAELLERLGRRLLELGARVAGVKLGARGLYLRTAAAARLASSPLGSLLDVPAWAERELWSPVFEVTVRGTVGAGDATYAGLLAAMLHRLGPEEALAIACAAGACSVEAPDATAGLQSWEETSARIAAGWPRDERPAPPGWARTAAGVYRGPGDHGG